MRLIVVLVQAVLPLAGLVLLEAHVEVQDHHILVCRGAGLVAPRGEDVVEEGHRRLMFHEAVEFLLEAEGVFGFEHEGGVVVRHVRRVSGGFRGGVNGTREGSMYHTNFCSAR